LKIARRIQVLPFRTVASRNVSGIRRVLCISPGQRPTEATGEPQNERCLVRTSRTFLQSGWPPQPRSKNDFRHEARPLSDAPVGIQADRQMDLLAAAVTTCATGRSAVKIRDFVGETGLEHRDIIPALRFLTDTGLLTSGPAGWTPTVSGVRVGQSWTTDREAARAVFGEVWRDSWVYQLLVDSVQPGVAHSVEEIAKAMRPYPTSRLSPWVHLVDWLELARYVERDGDGSLYLVKAVGAEGTAREEDQDQPKAPAADPQLGLVLPLSMDQLLHLTAEDYGAVMRSLATIYDVLSRQRA
jgi:hypothetical protein